MPAFRKPVAIDRLDQLREVSTRFEGAEDEQGRAAVEALRAASDAVERAQKQLLEALQASQVRSTSSEVAHG